MKVLLLAILTCVTTASAVELEGILHTQDAASINTEEEQAENQKTITREELKSINASAATIDDVLRLSPVATTARGPRSSGEAPQIRGLDQNKIFVTIDGARQNFQTGHNSMIALDTENLKAVDIFTSNSNIAQSGSIGGGVDFVTIEAEDLLRGKAKEGGELKTRYASANAQNSINGKYAFQDKNRTGLISVSSSTAQNLQLNNGENLKYSSFEDRSILVKNTYGNFGLKLEAFQRTDNAPLNPALTPPNRNTMDQSENIVRRTTLAADYKKRVNGGKLDGQVYFNGFGIEKQEQENQERDTRIIDTYGAKTNYRISESEYSNWTLGGEVFNDQLRSNSTGETELESYPNARGTNLVLYGQNDIKLTKDTTLSPGLRWNAYSLAADNPEFSERSDAAISRSIVLKTKWTPKLQTIASVSEGFRAPRLNELYPSGLHSPGDNFIIRDNFFLPNEDLEAETSLNREIKLRYQDSFAGGNGLLTFSGCAYENEIDNFIFLQRIDRSFFDPIDGSTQFVNIPEAKLYGGELELSLLYDAFDVGLTYMQVRGRNESADLWLEDLPADQYNFKLNYYLDRYGLTLGYLGHYALEQNRVNPQTIQRTEKTPSYLIHNIYASKILGDFQLNFRVDNLGNQEYRRHASFIFEAQENYQMAVTYKINTL